MKPGEKVVCIGDCYPKEIFRGEQCPEVGEIYTIREVRQTYWGVGLLLDELVNKPKLYARNRYVECCFASRKFKRITEVFGEMETSSQREKVNQN